MLHDRLMKTPEEAWKESRGGINLSWLAEQIGLTPAAVSAWSKVPAERVVRISNLLGVPRERLRPDLYQDPWSLNT